MGHRNDGIHALAKRPLANDGVGRVGVDIQNRPKVHMNPQSFRVPGNGLSVRIGQRRITGRPQGHGPWQARGGIQAHAQVPFGVHGDEQGNLSSLLQPLVEVPLPTRATLHVNHSAQVVLLYVLLQEGRMFRSFVGISRHHEQLPNFLGIGHLGQLVLGITPGFGSVVHPRVVGLCLACQCAEYQPHPCRGSNRRNHTEK